MSDPIYRTVTIASSATDSAEIDLTGGYSIAGVILPSAMTGTTIGLKVAATSGGTFVPVKDGNNDLALTSAASKYIYFDPKYTWGARYAKVVSGSAEDAGRSLTVALRQI